MKKEVFFDGIKDCLELEGIVNESTPIHITSLVALSIIAYVDENFSNRIKVTELKTINMLSDLMRLIGLENFS
jgi:acyl carrier protein